MIEDTLKYGRRSRASTLINLTPMVDVIFQLIVFLVLMANFTEQPAIELDLPEAGTATVVETSVPRITISPSGDLFWNREALVSSGDLPALLLAYKAEKENAPVRIMADRGVDYGRVVEVMDICRSNGLTNLIMGMEDQE